MEELPHRHATDHHRHFSFFVIIPGSARGWSAAQKPQEIITVVALTYKTFRLIRIGSSGCGDPNMFLSVHDEPERWAG